MKPAFSVTDSTHIQKIEAEGLKLLNELQSFIYCKKRLQSSHHQKESYFTI